MAGRGPAPKDPSQRARRNADPIPLRVIHADPVAQPSLPSFDVSIEVDGKLISQQFDWPTRTREWWQMWADSPLSAEFTATDWSELLDTAFLHAKFWAGDTKLAPELRQRAAKFGATPEDRARLRIQFAAANEADARQPSSGSGSSANPHGARSRYKGLGSTG